MGVAWRHWVSRDAGFHDFGVALGIRWEDAIDDGSEVLCGSLILNPVDQDMAVNERHVDACDSGDLIQRLGNGLMVW